MDSVHSEDAGQVLSQIFKQKEIPSRFGWRIKGHVFSFLAIEYLGGIGSKVFFSIRPTWTINSY